MSIQYLRFDLYCNLCNGVKVGEFATGDNSTDVLFHHFGEMHGWTREQVQSLNLFGGGDPYRYTFYTDEKETVARGEPHGRP